MRLAALALLTCGLTTASLACGPGPYFKFNRQAHYVDFSPVKDNPLVTSYLGGPVSLDRHSSPRVDKQRYLKQLQEALQPHVGQINLSFSDTTSTITADLWQLYAGKDRSYSDNTRWYLSNYGACHSNQPKSAIALLTAAAQSGLTAQQLGHLTAARHIVMLQCSEYDQQKYAAMFHVHTHYLLNDPATKPWALYVQGSAALYSGEYEAAYDAFNNSLTASKPFTSTAKHNWLNETNQYLLGRTALLAAQDDWGGWDDRDIKQYWVDSADRHFTDYLQRYPDGRYQVSAAGLQRHRIARFRGQNTLGENHELSLAQLKALKPENRLEERGYWHLGLQYWSRTQAHQEDLKPINVADAPPLLLAQAIMSRPDWAEHFLATLPDHEDKFALFPGLYEALLIEAEYQQGDYDAVTAIAMPAGYPEGLNRVVLDRKANSHLLRGEPDKALAIWQRLATATGESFELDIAASYAAAGDLHSIVRNISNENVLDEIFANICDNEQLLELAQDPQATATARWKASDALVMQNLQREQFQWLHDNYSQLPQNGLLKDRYAPIQTAITQLSNNPDHPQGLLNIGYFLMRNSNLGFMPSADPRMTQALQANSGAVCDDLDNKTRQRYGPWHYLARVVDVHNDTQHSEHEAKALHYLTNCHRAGENRRNCLWGNSSLPLPSSEASFNRLHKKYPQSNWATSAPYYYDSYGPTNNPYPYMTTSPLLYDY